MNMRTITMIAAGLALVASPALAQAVAHWQVLVAGKGVAMLVNTPTGSGTVKKLQAMAVFSPPVGAGVDRAIAEWVVDCKADTVNNVAGEGSLNGVTKPGVWNSATGGKAVVPAAGSVHRMLLEFACKGTRPSDDATVLTSVDDAGAYGMTLAKAEQ